MVKSAGTEPCYSEDTHGPATTCEQPGGPLEVRHELTIHAPLTAEQQQADI